MTTRVAVVTGANRGIGLEITRQLAKNKDIHVILTCRNEEEGQKALLGLSSTQRKITFHKLDVTDESSIKSFKNYLEHDVCRVDILVNNAGVFLDNHASKQQNVMDVELDILRKTMEVNLYGPLRLSQVLIPLMKKNKYGRIVNMSSGLGQISGMSEEFTAYRLSKVGLNALTRILAAQTKDQNILVNTMCPGWIKTRMGGLDAPGSVEEGADTAVWLAMLPDGAVSGQYFRNRTPIEW